MLILAVEQSSDTGSVAVLNDDKILGEREWDGLALRSCGLFTCLKDLLKAISFNLKDIAHYVVDAGPGSYSGLRSSFAAVRAFAMPDGQPIYALKSAEIMAWQVMEELAVDRVQVVGDARRQQLWTCLYEAKDGIPVEQSKLTLVAEKKICLVSDAVIVSPDWPRLHLNLKSAVKGNVRLIEERCIPKAGFLGQLAFRKMQLNILGEPLSPIYLHAAVKEGAK